MKAMAILMSVFLFIFASMASVEAAGHHSRDGLRDKAGQEKKGDILRVLNKLDLNAEQKKEVASILKKHRQDIGDAVTGMMEARKAFGETLMADEYSDAAVRQAAHRAAEQEEQLTVLIGRIVNEVKQVLTPAQKERIKKIRERRAEKMHGFASSRLSALDEWIAEHGE